MLLLVSSKRAFILMTMICLCCVGNFTSFTRLWQNKCWHAPSQDAAVYNTPTPFLSLSFIDFILKLPLFYLTSLQRCINSAHHLGAVVSSQSPAEALNRWTVTVPHILYLPFPPSHLSSQDTTHFLTMWQSTKHPSTTKPPPCFSLGLTHVEQL